ncbi:major capsid protein [Treponema sp. SP13]|uniref:major capsid protein n=1 Tax=Treponema sp. SP13 TaxID=2789742 RepID=UPI003D8C020F
MIELLKKILKMFTDDVRMQKRGFFTTFFKTTEEDYTDSEYADIDIERTGDQVAPVLKDHRTGGTIIDDDVFTEKKFKPPFTCLQRPVPLYDLMKRQPGESDAADVRGEWFGRLVKKIVKAISKMHRMCKEQVELQAAQIMQTGTVSLADESGNVVYDLDYNMKASHKPTVAVSWGAAGATPLSDIESLCDAINDDGKADPSIAVFGKNAWNAVLKNDEFKDMVKRDGLNLGQLSPALKNHGGRYKGYIDVGSYRLELWVYNDSYEKVKDGTRVKFMDPDKVIITAAIEDLDFRLVFGGIPTLGMKEPFRSVVPDAVKYEGFIKVQNRVFSDESNDTYTAEAKMRALAIPVSIDRFGCLKTTA